MPHVAISGELGSGKSAVAASLAGALDARVVSTGAIHRRIAAERGQSALETNLAAERDATIDQEIDAELQRQGTAEEPTVFDSRMAWHFVPDALKVHLVVETRVAAERMAGRGATAVETYGSVEEAVALADERHASEQRRFLATYGVDIDRLRNYDLVVDTSRATVDEVTARVLAFLHDPSTAGPDLVLCPRRLLPTRSPTAGEPGDTLPEVGYSRPFFFLLDGHAAVAAALRAGEPLVAATLRAEADEPVADGVSAHAFVRSAADGALLAEWQEAFDFTFDATPPSYRWFPGGPSGSGPAGAPS